LNHVIRKDLFSILPLMIMSLLFLLNDRFQETAYTVFFGLIFLFSLLEFLRGYLRPEWTYNDEKLCVRADGSMFRQICMSVNEIVAIYEIHTVSCMRKYYKTVPDDRIKYCFILEASGEMNCKLHRGNAEEVVRYRRFLEAISTLPNIQKTYQFKQ